MISILERLRAEGGGASSPYQCFHSNGFQKHKLPNGRGYSCDPSNPLWVDPEIGEREDAIAALEGTLAKLSESTASKDALAIAERSLKERIGSLKKDLGAASKVAAASRKFDPKIEAAKQKAVTAKAAYEATCAAVKATENERTEYNHGNRLERLESLARSKVDMWRDAILASGLSEGDRDQKAGYSIRISQAISSIESAEELALTLASLSAAMARLWAAAGHHPHKLTSAKSQELAIDEICAGVVARLATLAEVE